MAHPTTLASDPVALKVSTGGPEGLDLPYNSSYRYQT